jgi:hypothetical protein
MLIVTHSAGIWCAQPLEKIAPTVYKIAPPAHPAEVFIRAHGCRPLLGLAQAQPADGEQNPFNGYVQILAAIQQQCQQQQPKPAIFQLIVLLTADGAPGVLGVLVQLSAVAVLKTEQEIVTALHLLMAELVA